MEVASDWPIKRDSFSGYDSGEAVMARAIGYVWCSSGNEDG